MGMFARRISISIPLFLRSGGEVINRIIKAKTIVRFAKNDNNIYAIARIIKSDFKGITNPIRNKIVPPKNE